MFLRLAADAVVVLHIAFILFVVGGGTLVLRCRRFIWLHLLCAAWGAWIELSGGICPLTPLENRLRAAAGSAGYHGGFIEHYLLPVIYPVGLTRTTQIVLGAAVVVINVLVYAVVIRRWLRRGTEGGSRHGG